MSPSSSSSSTESSPPVIRRCRTVARPVVIPTLRDEEIDLPESPRARSANSDDEGGSSVIRDEEEETAEVSGHDDEAADEDLTRAIVVRSYEDVEVVTTEGPSSSRKSRGQRQRGPRRKGKTRGPEYLRCDNDCNILPSWSTPETIRIMREYCKMSDDIVILIPTIEQRPWDCPRGFVCLHESYFLEADLWFPLPAVLISYCRWRGIAISQLTTKSICHIVGLITLGAEVGVQITRRFLEEICQIKGSKTFYVSTKPAYNVITHNSGDNIKHWQRFYFFAKIDELTSPYSDASFYSFWAEKYGRLGRLLCMLMSCYYLLELI